MHASESRQPRLHTVLSAVACSVALLATSGAVFGEDQAATPDLSSQIVGRVRDPILPHGQATVCHAMIMEGSAKSLGFSGKVLIAADPQARLTTIQVTDAGPANFAIGVAGSKVWVRDYSGVVRDVDFDGYRAGLVSDAYWASGGLMNACWPAAVRFLKADKVGGVSADVLEVVPEGGKATQVWISRKTQLPLRWSRRDEPDVATTTYSNYGRGRSVGMPLKQSTVDLDGNRLDLTIKKIQMNADPAVVAAQAQKPAQGAPDYSIDGGTSTTVPMRLTQQPHVDVMINGKGPFNFMLDTGGSLMLTPATAKAAGLKLSGAGSVKGIVGRAAPKKFAHISDLSIGAAHLTDQYTTVMNPAQTGFDTTTAGSIGYEVLARFTTSFDFPKQQLTLSLAPDQALLDDPGALPMQIDHTMPTVTGAIDGVSDYLWLDTGYNGTLMINRPFTQAHAEAMPQKLYAGSTISGTGGIGATQCGRIPHLAIGAASFTDVIAMFPSFPAGPNSDAEIAADIGDTVFSSSVLTFDYRTRRVWLKPSDSAAPPPVASYNQTGFGLDYDKGTVAKVSYVMEGSPAAEVGLHKGDKVVAINQQSMSGEVITAIKQRIAAQDSSPIQLTVLRDGKVTEFEVQPRAYIQ